VHGTTTNERPAANVPSLPAGAIRALLICDLLRLPMPGKTQNVADRIEKGNDDTPALCIRHTACPATIVPYKQRQALLTCRQCKPPMHALLSMLLRIAAANAMHQVSKRSAQI